MNYLRIQSRRWLISALLLGAVVSVPANAEGVTNFIGKMLNSTLGGSAPAPQTGNSSADNPNGHVTAFGQSNQSSQGETLVGKLYDAETGDQVGTLHRGSDNEMYRYDMEGEKVQHIQTDPVTSNFVIKDPKVEEQHDAFADDEAGVAIHLNDPTVDGPGGTYQMYDQHGEPGQLLRYVPETGE